jgi:hypothetical protein
MERHQRAPEGVGWYYANLVALAQTGMSKSGEIEQCNQDSWVGARGLHRAFIGKVWNI